MYVTRVWPVIVVLATALMSWAYLPAAGWGYVAALLVLGLGIAALATALPVISTALARPVLLGLMVVSVMTIAVSASQIGDPLLAVPFIAGIAGCTDLWKRTRRETPAVLPGATTPA